VDPESDVERNIFSPFVTEVGIGVETAFRAPGDEASISYVAVADFAEPLERRSFVVGTVYEDRNHDGLIDDDEGIPGLEITVKPSYSAVWEIVKERSDPMGRYQINLSSLPTGLMDLYVEWEGDVLGPFSFVVERAGVNVLRNIRIEPPSRIDSAGTARVDEKKLDRSMRICY